jgi:hypothetical protein
VSDFYKRVVLKFVPDPARALSAMRSRLRPGGVLAAYVWDYTGVQFLNEFWQEAVALDAGAASLDETRRFSLCNQEALVSVFGAAGLGDVALTRLELATPFSSFEDYWQPFLGRTGPAPSYLASLEPQRREQLKERLRERLRPEADGSIPLRASAWAVRGLAGSK